MLDAKITVHLEILDFVVRINKRTAIFDTKLDIHERLGKYDLVLLWGRPAVEDPSLFKSTKRVQIIIKSLDAFCINKLQLVESKCLQQSVYVYIYIVEVWWLGLLWWVFINLARLIGYKE